MTEDIAPQNYCFICQGDAFEWLATLTSKSVDLVITDPPYASIEKYRATGTTTRLSKSSASSNQWFAGIPNDKLYPLMNELYRVLKPKTHCYVFCDDETSDILKDAGIKAGFYCWKRLVHDKMAIGMGYHYRAKYEFILFFEKGTAPWTPAPGKLFNGTRQLNNKSTPDILAFKRIKSAEAYPTEKPFELVETLVLNSSAAGDVVIDPFFGSGVVGKAAIHNSRLFWGCDISLDSVERTIRSLSPYSI